MNSQQRLFARYIADISPGTLTWIGVRPKRREPLVALQTVQAIASLGLDGDHRVKKTPNSSRQVTLISEEYIQQIEHFSGFNPIHPSQLRRNLVVKGLNLTLLRHQRFQIGDALFEATALCHPCSRMEETIGKGGLAAMMGHGGLCAKIIQSGRITIGDAVRVLPPTED